MGKTRRMRSNGGGTARAATTPGQAPASASSAGAAMWSAPPVRTRVAAARLATTLERLGSSDRVVGAARQG
jgi:hypothetical protein